MRSERPSMSAESHGNYRCPKPAQFGVRRTVVNRTHSNRTDFVLSVSCVGIRGGHRWRTELFVEPDYTNKTSSCNVGVVRCCMDYVKPHFGLWNQWIVKTNRIKGVSISDLIQWISRHHRHCPLMNILTLILEGTASHSLSRKMATTLRPVQSPKGVN